MRKIKLSTWAKENNYSWRGAYARFKRKKIKNAFQDEDTGSIFVIVDSIEHDLLNKSEVNENEIETNVSNVYIYARVSSFKQKDDLIRQINRIEDFSAAKGYIINKIFKEVASGMSDNRKQLNKLYELCKENYTNNKKNKNIIVIENKDRLTRYGFEFVKNMFSLLNTEIVVINQTEQTTDSLQDLISVIYSFCAKTYSKRKSKEKTIKIEQILEAGL